jgi:hypothetical protein
MTVHKQDAGPGVDWDTNTSDKWLEDVDRLIDGFPAKRGESWSATFPCPRCTHTIVKDVPYIVAVDVIKDDTIFIRCHCEEPHKNRPEDKTGCGHSGHFQSPWTRPQAR